MSVIRQYWDELDIPERIFFVMITEIHKKFPNGIVYESDNSYTFYVVDDHKLYFVKNMSAKSPKVTSVKEAKQLSSF